MVGRVLGDKINGSAKSAAAEKGVLRPLQDFNPFDIDGIDARLPARHKNAVDEHRARRSGRRAAFTLQAAKGNSSIGAAGGIVGQGFDEGEPGKGLQILKIVRPRLAQRGGRKGLDRNWHIDQPLFTFARGHEDFTCVCIYSLCVCIYSLRHSGHSNRRKQYANYNGTRAAAPKCPIR